MAQLNAFQAIKLQWPEQATAWLNELDGVKSQIQGQQAGTADKIKALASLINYQPSELANDAAAAAEKATQTLTAQFAKAPFCLAITPFQAGVGTGEGYYKTLAAPNVINQLLKKLDDGGDSNRPSGNHLDALLVLFLSTNYQSFSDVLSVFNSLLNIEELEMAQRRSRYLDELEKTRQIIPKAGTLPAWQTMNMEKLNVVNQIKGNLTGTIADLTSYTTSSPIETLTAMLESKQKQQANSAAQLEKLKQSLNNQSANAQMQGIYLTGGTTSGLKKALETIEGAPGYEWPLCAGVCFIAEPAALAFIREVVSLTPTRAGVK